MPDTLSPIRTEDAAQPLVFGNSLAPRQTDANSPGNLVSNADRPWNRPCTRA